MKIRLNKKTKEELSTGMVLGTLQTKQKQVEEDITAYIDEPFLKPENLRHGITIAGVDGKYLDEVKYVNIWNEDGTLLRTLASTELNPTVGRRGDSVYLTNRPFEDQVAFGVGDSNYFVRFTPDQPESPHSFYDDPLNMTQAKQADVVIANALLSWEEAFRNIPTSTEINIPYYVELPTKAYELGFDEDVAIGETSRMLIQRNSNYMEYNHYLMNLESAAPGLHKVSDTFFDTSRVTVYETLSQRIIVQYLSYRYNADDISQVHEELRVIEDSRTGEFNRLAFSNTGQGPVEGYSEMPDDPVTFVMLSDNANSPSGHYATSDTYRWGGAMGFVFKLRDGKFFIIDGGIGGNNPAHTKYDSQAPILAAALKQYASDPNNIKIAGWLLTHAHQDHVGVFCEFIEKPEYKSIISIDKVIYSLPVESFQCFKDARAAQTYKEFDEALNVLRAEGKTEIVKAHMGMKFNLGGLGLTILSAPENVYRSYSPGTEDPISDFDNINDTCIVSQVDYAGKKLIFMADACDVQIGAVVMPLVANVIGEATALQVPHHGYADTKSSRLYTQIGQLTLESNLEFTIWPLCYEHFSGKQVNGEDYYEGGKKYNSVFAHSNNAALQNIQAIYPENNYSMVATSSTIGEWTFTPVDFVKDTNEEIVGYCWYCGAPVYDMMNSIDPGGIGMHFYCDKHYPNWCENGHLYLEGTCPECSNIPITFYIDNIAYTVATGTTWDAWICSGTAPSWLELREGPNGMFGGIYNKERNVFIMDTPDEGPYNYNYFTRWIETIIADKSYYSYGAPELANECPNCGQIYSGDTCPECGVSSGSEGHTCSYPGCENVGDWSSTDYDGTMRYYCCDDHYNNYCGEHGVYYGPEGTECPECNYIGKCAYCRQDIYGGADDYQYSNGRYYHTDCPLPHDYCAHCHTGIYGDEYKYCDKCGMICSNCTECGNCYVPACGADTRSKCILCGNYYCGYHSSGQNDGKCLRCKGIEFS